MLMNSLLQPTTTPHGAYPFDQVQVGDFREAFDQAIQEKEQEIQALIASEDRPTFANTIAALERSGARLEWVSGIFFNLLHAAATDELMAISQEVTPRLSALSSFITLSDALFERVRSVWEEREGLSLDAEDLRLLERTYEGFMERGALLPPEASTSPMPAVSRGCPRRHCVLPSRLPERRGERAGSSPLLLRASSPSCSTAPTVVSVRRCIGLR